VARRLCPRLGFNAADTELVAWLIEQHLTMSTVAQSRDSPTARPSRISQPSCNRLRADELLTILTTADIRGVGPGVWNGWKAQLLRTLYYETEPVLTGASRRSTARSVSRWPGGISRGFHRMAEQELNAYVGRHYPPMAQVELARQNPPCALFARQRTGRP